MGFALYGLGFIAPRYVESARPLIEGVAHNDLQKKNPPTGGERRSRGIPRERVVLSGAVAVRTMVVVIPMIAIPY